MISETEIYIKIYLNYMAEWKSYIQPSNKKPIWLSTYSMLNLLNLPDIMKRFGPLRNFWEGTTMGEGILKIVKGLYTYMHPTWFITLTKKIMKMRSLHKIRSKIMKLNKQKHI